MPRQSPLTRKLVAEGCAKPAAALTPPRSYRLGCAIGSLAATLLCLGLIWVIARAMGHPVTAASLAAGWCAYAAVSGWRHP